MSSPPGPPESRGRLVLTRRVGERIIIQLPPEPLADGSVAEPLTVEIYLAAIPSSSRARLSITAPDSVRIHRSERTANGSKPDPPEDGSHA